MAAMVVVLYHSARHLNFAYGLPTLMKVFQFGHAGVDLFFVISGFIILFVHYDDIGRPKRLGRYVNRRFTRIMPTYWVALALTILLGIAGQHHKIPQIFDLIWSATLLPSHKEPLLGVAWTLQYEIMFYIVFCFLILNRKIGIVLFILWFTWVSMALYGIKILGYFPSSLFGVYNFEFFIGMAVAYFYRNRSVRAPRVILISGILLFCAVSAAEDFGFLNGYADIARFFYGPAGALIVLGAAEAGRQSLVTVPRILQALGSASYSIYLFQFVFIGVAWKLWLATGLDRSMPHGASFPLLVAAGVVGGIAVSRLVEYPLMKMVRSGLPIRVARSGL